MSFELRDGSPELVTLACLYVGHERPLHAAHEMGMAWDAKRDMLRVFARHGLLTDPTRPDFRITEWGCAVYEAHCLGGAPVTHVSIPPARWSADPTPPDRRERPATTRATPAAMAGARRPGGRNARP